MADGGEQGLRVLVADDEPPALAELVWLLEQDPLVREVVGVGRAAEALRRLGEGGFDALLTDVRMPGRDGRDLARAVNRLSRPPAVVFVTAYEVHAVEAFDLEVVDYLLKPVRPARLAATLRRVAAQRAPGGSGGPADGAGAPGEDEVTVAVELGGVTTLVPRRSVRWVEASGDYVRLHTDDGSHLLRTPLGALEQQWAEAGFARIHRSLLVNLAAVREVRTDAGRCTLVLGGAVPAELPVARRHTREVRERLLRRSPGT